MWMMYRSDWGRSKGQEVILAIRLQRSFFESLTGGKCERRAVQLGLRGDVLEAFGKREDNLANDLLAND